MPIVVELEAFQLLSNGVSGLRVGQIKGAVLPRFKLNLDARLVEVHAFELGDLAEEVNLAVKEAANEIR